MEDYVWWVSCGRSITLGGARSVDEYDWKHPDSLLVVPTSESVNQAKVVRAHAALLLLWGL